MHVFFRDTCSYLVLLGLHFVICLAPATVHFTAIEWAIFIFILGRVVMEISQLQLDSKRKMKWKQILKEGLKHYVRLVYTENSAILIFEVPELSPHFRYID